MAKLKIELEVDNIKLFDALTTLQGRTDTLGCAIISAIMTTDDLSMSEAIILEMYGIKLTKVIGATIDWDKM